MQFYVYELSDPITGDVFYVGKGKGDRVGQHEAAARAGKPGAKCDRIRQIWASGAQVARIIVKRFARETDAYAAEVERIALYGVDSLTNVSRGGRGGRHRAKPLWGHKEAPSLLARARRLLSDAGPGGVVEACGVDITDHVKWIAERLEAPVGSAA